MLSARQRKKAERNGVCPKEWERRLLAGEQWCRFCKAFHPAAAFYGPNADVCREKNSEDAYARRKIREAKDRADREAGEKPDDSLKTAPPPKIVCAPPRTTDSYHKRPGIGYAAKMANSIF